MTPDETSPVPVDKHLLAQMMACDALLHADPDSMDRNADGPGSAAMADDLARGRLLLLLRLLDAAEATSGAASDERAGGLPEYPGEPPTLLGRFEILEDLGSGGFGFVVRARDRLLGREVALKMPLPERVLGPADVRRFLREAQAAARLDHPSIVRVFDAGELGPLGYFIASEFCAGPSLRQWLKAQSAPVPSRTAARWVAALADAVQHAHERGILHRDIKPDNVILAAGSRPEGFVPRLTDFGLAKVIEEAGDESRSGARVGTPQYMAPEQAAGHHREVGPATDVYALGVTLYEVLTGRPPFRDETEAETLRLVLDSEPVALRSMRPGLSRDLETICLKCLRKEPARRYLAAADLRDDLRRFLDGRQIQARRVSPAETAWRWCLRNKAVAGLLIAVFGLLATVAGIASVGYVREAAARGAAEAAESKAKDEAGRAHAAEQEMRRQWYAATINLMQPAWDTGQVGRLRELLTATETYPDRGFEWSYYQRLCHLERLTLIGHRASIRSVAWSPDGTRLATASWDRTVRIWDAAAGREILALEEPTGQANAVAWSPDGTRLATASWDGTARVWDPVAGRKPMTLKGHAGRVWSVAWSPDGTRLATASEDGTAKTWDAADGRERITLEGHAGYVVCVAWSPDGEFLATGGVDGTTNVWGARDGRALLKLEGLGGWINSIAWSPDGKLLATGSWNGTVRVWEATGGRESLILNGHAGWINSVAWSPDGKLLATGNSDGTARVWDAGGGRQLLILLGPDSVVNTVAWSPDGKYLAMGSADGTAKVWHAAVRREYLTLKGHRSKVNAVAWSPDGTRLATASWDGTARVWDAASRRDLQTFQQHTSEVWSVAWSPNGARLATASADGTARVWDAADGREPLTLVGHSSKVVSVSWSSDGTRLATASWDGTARMWDTATGRQIRSLEGHTSEVWSVAWAPDGKRLATGARDGTARVWDTIGGRELLRLRGASRRIITVAWSPDGTRLATGGDAPTAKVWSTADGRELLSLSGHTGQLRQVCWSPDGTRMATASADGTAKVWDAEGGRELLTLTGHTGFIRSVCWSPDGTRLATAGDDGTARVWESANPEPAPRSTTPAPTAAARLARNTFGGPGAQGFIPTWLLLLPMPIAPGERGEQALDRHQLSDEPNLCPRPGERCTVDGRELVWRAHRSPEAVLDFNAVLGHATERSVAYAVCYLESDRARDGLWLQVSSDDQAVVYLNSREVYRCPVPRPLETLDTVGRVSLKPGRNVLLLKVVNETGTWEAIARLVDDEGRAAEGIRVRSSP